VVARALSKRPEDRYPDAASMAEDLEDARVGRQPRHRAGWTAPARSDMTVMSQRGSAHPPPAVGTLDARIAGRGSALRAAPKGERVAPRTLSPPARSTVAAGERHSTRGGRRWLIVAAGGLLAVGAALALGLGISRWRAAPRPVAVERAPEAAGRRPAGGDQVGSRARVAATPQAIETAEPTPESVAGGERPFSQAWPRFPVFGKPAGLVIDVEHSLKSGRMRAWVDSDLVLDQRLQARVTRQILVYKSRKGGLSKTLEVDPGEHVVRVQIDAGDTTLVDQVSARFERGVTLHLQVDVGGLLKKRMTLSWG
jgi:hypothetical protein